MNPDSIPNGGPAHPCNPSEYDELGLSIRDHFAGLAMQGLLARGIHYQTEGVRMPAKGLEEADIAGHAYAMADAMLAAREAK